MKKIRRIRIDFDNGFLETSDVELAARVIKLCDKQDRIKEKESENEEQ